MSTRIRTVVSRTRRTGWRPAARLLPAGLLAVAAGVLGGLLGVLLGFLAVLLLVDRLLDRVLGPAGLGTLEAEHAFLRLSHQRRRAALDRRLHHRSERSDDLAYLAEESGWVAVAGRRRLGVIAIPLESIVGTVDRHKSTTFDRCFRPPDWSRGRWTLMFRAVRRGAELPPISVCRVGDEHFVRDGHHRVSVARATGAEAIDASVVELVSR
jgi:hypothetical protein